MRKLYIFLPVIFPIIAVIFMYYVFASDGPGYLITRDVDSSETIVYSYESPSSDTLDGYDNIITEYNSNNKIEFFDYNYDSYIRQVGTEYNSVLPGDYSEDNVTIYQLSYEEIPNYDFKINNNNVALDSYSFEIKHDENTIKLVYNGEAFTYLPYIEYSIINDTMYIYTIETSDVLVLSPKHDMQVVDMNDQFPNQKGNLDYTYSDILLNSYIVDVNNNIYKFKDNLKDYTYDIINTTNNETILTCNVDSEYVDSEFEEDFSLYYQYSLYDYDDQYITCGNIEGNKIVAYDIKNDEQFTFTIPQYSDIVNIEREK